MGDRRQSDRQCGAGRPGYRPSWSARAYSSPTKSSVSSKTLANVSVSSRMVLGLLICRAVFDLWRVLHLIWPLLPQPFGNPAVGEG